MNILDNASLILTPNGYKASKLYSIVPTDGSGDMTFARTGGTATRVNPNGLIEVDAANIPRLDYLGGGCPKLLLEPQRTNLFSYSNNISNAYWSKRSNIAITENSIISPDGNINAARIYATDNATVDYAFFKILTSGNNTFSIFAKKGEMDYIFLGKDNTNANGVIFNLANGTISNNPSSFSAKIEDYGNGWYRCSVYFTAISYCFVCPTTFPTTIIFNNGLNKGLYVYGVQAEAGAYATSYIPTTTASVTRNEDVCSKTSATALIGQTEGTIFVNVDLNHTSFTNNGYIAQVSNSSTNRIFIYREANTNKLGAFILVGGSTVYNVLTAASVTGITKVAFAYKSGNSVFYVNGTQVGTSSSTYTIGVSLDKVFLDENDNLEHGSFNYNQLLLFKTRLTNSELATLTTI